MELYPELFVVADSHPQCVAVKSLMLLPPELFWVMVYTMWIAWKCFCFLKNVDFIRIS